MIGEPLNGTWTLNIRDRTANNGTAGSIQSWVLQAQASSLAFSPTDLPKNIVDNGAIQSSVLVNGGTGAVVEGTGEASGTGGDIFLNARSVGIQNEATVSASNSGSGQGGTVQISASEGVTMSGTNSGVFTNATGHGPGGSIEVEAGRVDMTNGATISAASLGPGNAGDIELTAVDTILLDGAPVTTEAAQASGGNIELTAEELIHLKDSKVTTRVQEGSGSAGSITFDPDFIVIRNSDVLSTAVFGDGGPISMVANDAILIDQSSNVDASSQFGGSGTINIQAPTKFLSGAIVPLESQPVEVATLYGARCVAGAGGHFSTFVDSKKDSLSPTPGTFLASPLLLPLGQAVADTSAGLQTPVILTASIAPLVLGHAGESTAACP